VARPRSKKSAPAKILPMQLRVGDRFSDETGEWEIASQRYPTAGGESVTANVRRVDRPATVEDRTWVSHERIRVKGVLSGSLSA
jgi:hypothetical protein